MKNTELPPKKNINILIVILIALGLFTSALFLRDIPDRISHGNAARVAISTLDEVRRPFFKLYGAEKLVLKDGYSSFAQQLLDEGIQDSELIVDEFIRSTQYEPKLSSISDGLKNRLNTWVSYERKLFDLLSKEKSGVLTGNEAEISALLAETSKGFFSSMAHLGKAEKPIHDGMDVGSDAVNELIAIASLLLILLLLSIYYLQWSRSQTQAELLKAVTLQSERLEEEVQARTKDLVTAQQELIVKQRLAAIGQLTATVSHELRNPLGSIRNALAVVQRLINDDNPMMENAMLIMDRGISRCDLIITELLDYTRIKELHRETTDIDSWLGNELDNFTLAPNIKLNRQLNSNAKISCDRERLLRALLNGLNNASDALQPESPDETVSAPQLSVSTQIVGNHLDIEIADNGVGIEKELQAKIFEPLFSTKSFGVGLGMPVVEQVLQQHGGHVKLESKPSKGTRLHLLLPLEEPKDNLVNETMAKVS